jgi:hypothetical protein
MNTKWAAVVDSFDITPEIDPYMIIDQKADVELMMLANGNKAVVSQRTAVEKAGLSMIPEKEYELIRSETKEDKTFDITSPTE